jgi:hypothetical protein
MKFKLPFKNLLLFYSAAASLFLTLSGFFSVREIQNASFQLIFLPVTMYLFVSASNAIKSKLRNDSLDDGSNITKVGKKSFVFFTLLYLLLVVFGIGGIRAQSTQSEKPSEETSPIIIETKDINSIIVKVTPKNGVPLNIHSRSSKDSEILQSIENVQEYPYKSETENWYKIYLGDGEFGYVHKDFAITQGE